MNAASEWRKCTLTCICRNQTWQTLRHAHFCGIVCVHVPANDEIKSAAWQMFYGSHWISATKRITNNSKKAIFAHKTQKKSYIRAKDSLNIRLLWRNQMNEQNGNAICCLADRISSVASFSYLANEHSRSPQMANIFISKIRLTAQAKLCRHECIRLQALACSKNGDCSSANWPVSRQFEFLIELNHKKEV